MFPKGKVRDIIKELDILKGAYIIVSGKDNCV